MHTALISLVLMCGACGDAPRDDVAMNQPVVRSISLQPDFQVVSDVAMQDLFADKGRQGWSQ
jgi:hypothetical protein